MKDKLEKAYRELKKCDDALIKTWVRAIPNSCQEWIVGTKSRELSDEMKRIVVTLDTLCTYDLCGESRIVRNKLEFYGRTKAEYRKFASPKCLFLKRL